MATKIAKFRKKIYVTGLGYKQFSLPKSYGDLLKTRIVDVTILSNGNIIIKPVNNVVDVHESKE